jgi:superfamily II DNA/RNA helicase
VSGERSALVELAHEGIEGRARSIGLRGVQVRDVGRRPRGQRGRGVEELPPSVGRTVLVNGGVAQELAQGCDERGAQRHHLGLGIAQRPRCTYCREQRLDLGLAQRCALSSHQRYPDRVRGACVRPTLADCTALRNGMNTSSDNDFASLGVAPDLVAALHDRGITQPFAIQTLTIPDALAGRDVCGKAKTGSGKTLAFGLPVIERVASSAPKAPAALIMVPTRELALQVAEELEPLAAARGRSVLCIYGGASMEAQIKGLGHGADIVVATPGRLIDLLQQDEVSVAAVDMVVIDEADRMADMGFLPQVEWILRHIEGGHQTLLFSATLDGVVDSLVKRYQRDPVFHEVSSPTVTVDLMLHRFLMVHEMDKVKVAAAIARHANRTIIFSRTKHGADRLARELEKEGVTAAPIHGDLRQGHREKALKDFSTGKLQVLVATDVAARGIHIDDVDVVIHYDPAEDHKAYLHRSGRTARAGESGVVVTLGLWNQELEIKRLLKRLGLDEPLVQIFSNDPRLTDIARFEAVAS